MFDRSPDWYRLIVGSHTIVEQADVLAADGTVLATLDVIDGDVTEDIAAEVRHHATLTAVDATGELTPRDVDDLLMPTGTRVRISRGIAESSEPLVPLGTVFLTGTSTSLDVEGRATIPLTGYDRAVRLQRPSPRPVTVTAGQPIVDAIHSMLTTADPTVEFDPPMVTGHQSPRLVFESDTDMWAEASGLAAAAGGELFVSRHDRVVVRPVPVTERWAEPVWTVVEADDERLFASTAVDAETQIEADQLPNGVVVIGQHSSMSTPVRGEAWDLDPESPTYRYGRYGSYARFVRTEKATTTAMATAMAGAILQTIGAATEVDVEVWPPPVHLVCGDPVRLDLPSVGARGNYLLARMVTSLANPEAPAQCTFRRSLIAEEDISV